MSTNWMLEPKTAAAHSTLLRLEHEAGAGVFGAFVGAVVGAGAGLPGVLAGAIFGAVAGTMAGAVVDATESHQAARTRELDRAIGTSEETLGAPNLAHPPRRR